MDYKLERSKLWFPIIKFLVGFAIEGYTNFNIEMPKQTKELIQVASRRNISIFYYSLHKSMLETLAIPYAIYKKNGDIPFIIAAGSLFDGSNADIMKNVGVILIDNKSQVREAERIANDVAKISKQHPTLTFPETKRTRTGAPDRFANASFEAAIKSAQQWDTYAICIDPSYSEVKEVPEFIKELEIKKLEKQAVASSDNMEKGARKYKFSRNDIIPWLKYYADVYITFSKPMKVDKDYNRKELSTLCFNMCLDNIKILPIHVYATAIEWLKERGLKETPENIESLINEVLYKIMPHASKFRGFDSTYKAKDLLHIVTKKDDPKEYAYYMNNIEHIL